MKIAKVTVLAFSRQLDGRAWNPVFRWHERRAPLLLIEMASGEVGVGEGWSQYTNCEAVLALLAEQVAPRLIGRCIETPREAAAALMQEISTDMPWADSAAVSAVTSRFGTLLQKGNAYHYGAIWAVFPRAPRSMRAAVYIAIRIPSTICARSFARIEMRDLPLIK